LQKFIGKIDLVPINHHLSHAASAYFNSGFDEANILVMDGQGEEETITIYDASNKNLSLISRTAWPNSLGIFYLEGTKVLGYSLGDEYKVMGMSAYGKPIYQKALETSFDINNNGELAITESDYLGFCEIKDTGHRSIYFKEKLKNKFKIAKDNNFEQNHFDFASSLQSTVENTGIGLSEWAFEKTKKNKICLSGGVALNGLMNNKILNSNNFSDAFVYPASGDDGTSVGSALYYLSQNKDFNFFNKKISTCFYGFKNKLNLERDKKILKDLNIERSEHIQKFVASKLSKNFVVAIYDSNLGSEFGPRSLGGRSILANPTNPKMKEILNKKIKLREPFRPFAPICLKDNVADFFEIKCESSFMLFICETKKEKKHLIPSVVHEDDTARVQSVSEENGNLYKILKEFNIITKVPILINTSFNIGGEAIVNTVEDAILSFKKMDIDYLVIDNYIISKKDKFIPNNMDTKKFIENRKSRFKEKNNFHSINISYYNSNFYNSFYSYLKRKIIENIINKKYI
jgi:carbamoyltransferase